MSKVIKEQRRFKINKSYVFKTDYVNIIYYKIKTLSGYCVIATYGENLSPFVFESQDENRVDYIMLCWLSNKFGCYDHIKFI